MPRRDARARIEALGQPRPATLSPGDEGPPVARAKWCRNAPLSALAPMEKSS
jgi:hypothetical protein